MTEYPYEQIRSLMASSDQAISSLASITDNLIKRIEALEKRQTELLEEINLLRKRWSVKHKSLKFLYECFIE